MNMLVSVHFRVTRGSNMGPALQKSHDIDSFMKCMIGVIHNDHGSGKERKFNGREVMMTWIR
jgi:hypothetical protein